jgi:1-acyl-sn-glycerol-3-phosphate acyltransferase
MNDTAPAARQLIDADTARPAPARGFGAAFARLVCSSWLKLGGWRMAGDWPAGVKKCVLVAAPHTSNWDGVNMLAAAGFYRIKLRWMGKKSLTRGPLGFITRWAGVVPIDRNASSTVVSEMKQAFAAAEHLVLAIAPEGTRTLATEWKKGFYNIAFGAGVPIVLSVLDYRRRTISLAAMLQPSGDYAADWAFIRAFYANAGAKFPARYAVPE